MTCLSGVWAYYHPETFCLIFYQRNGLWCNLYRPEQQNTCQKFVRLYLVSLFKSVRWRCRGGMIMIVILFLFVFVFVWRRLIRRNKKLCDLKHMLNVLSSHASRENFSKHPECFGRILRVKFSRLPNSYSQNPPKIFGTFRKVYAAYMARWRLNMYFKAHIF